MEGKMKAFRIVAPNKVELQDMDIPTIKGHEVLIKVIATGICTTDVELYDGSMPYYRQGLSKMPLTAGHEWSGTIAEIGSDVKNLEIGDLVVGDISIGCGKCKNCLKGFYHLCSNRTELGVIRYDGSMAEYLVSEGKNVYKVPKGVSAEQAALVEPLATVLYAVRRTKIEPGDNIVVFGDGPIGLLNAQLANYCGAAKVAVVARKGLHKDLIENKWGLKLINSSNTDVSNAITEYFGDLADVVFEDTGNPDAFQSAIKAVTPGGRIGALSITGKSKIEVDVDYITTRDITVVGVLASPNSFIPALNMIAAKKIDVESCISHRFPFEETPQALDFAKNSSSKGKIKVLIIKD